MSGEAPRAVSPTRATLQLTFILLLSLTINCLLWLLSPAGYEETALSHTIDMILARSGDDSWGPMALALEYLGSPGQKPLYAALFFEGGIKFQYPPSALFTLLLMFLAGPERVRISDDMTPLMWPAVNDLIGWACILLMAISCAALLELRLRQTYADQDWSRWRWVRFLLVFLLTVTFYPLVKGFTLGQVQIWISALFAVATLFFALEWRASAGVFLGLMSLIKPHYGLTLLWGALNRDWRFAMGIGVAVLAGLVFSIMRFGWANHLDYLSVVSFMSERGEAYYANHAINGLLNRFIGRSAPELYHNTDFGGFPPYNGWVYWPTLLTSGAIVLASLLRRSDRSHRLISFCLVSASVTVASPIAWEHHFAVLLPVYVVAYVALAHSPGRLISLAVSYILVASYIAVARLLAPTFFNIFQSYMLFGSLILLALLHALLPWRAEPRENSPSVKSEVVS